MVNLDLKKLEGKLALPDYPLHLVPPGVFLQLGKARSGGLDIRRTDTGETFWVAKCDILAFDDGKDFGVIRFRGPLMVGDWNCAFRMT